MMLRALTGTAATGRKIDSCMGGHVACERVATLVAHIQQNEILANLEVLKTMGPNLGRPRVDHIKGSTHQNMKELRVQFKGDPVRILFAFDPDRRAVLLLGGAKTGDDRWYRKNIHLADQDFTLHLQEMQKEKKKHKEKKR